MGQDLSATRANAIQAKKNVEQKFRGISDNITSKFKDFDSKMSLAMTGPQPSANLTKMAANVNAIYTTGNLCNYFEDLAKKAVAGFNSMAANVGAGTVGADIDTSYTTVSHDGGKDTEKLEIRHEYAHDAIQALSALIKSVSEYANTGIGVNIEGAEDIDTNAVSNLRSNTETLNSNFSEMAKMMQQYFTQLSEADSKQLKAIADSLLQK